MFCAAISVLDPGRLARSSFGGRGRHAPAQHVTNTHLTHQACHSVKPIHSVALPYCQTEKKKKQRKVMYMNKKTMIARPGSKPFCSQNCSRHDQTTPGDGRHPLQPTHPSLVPISLAAAAAAKGQRSRRAKPGTTYSPGQVTPWHKGENDS